MALARWKVEWLIGAPEPEPLPTLADLLPPRPEWQAQAACRSESTALFFANRARQSRRPEMCAGRVQPEGPAPGGPVRAPGALDYALEHGLVGVWGGTTDAERRAIRREAS